jgi:hypothetical protein
MPPRRWLAYKSDLGDSARQPEAAVSVAIQDHAMSTRNDETFGRKNDRGVLLSGHFAQGEKKEKNTQPCSQRMC